MLGVIIQTGVPEGIPQAIESSLGMGEAGLIVAICIAVLQGLIRMVKTFTPQSGFMKKHGKKFVIIASAILAVLTPIAVGVDWTQSLLIFVAGGATTYINDFVHAMGWIAHKRTIDGNLRKC